MGTTRIVAHLADIPVGEGRQVDVGGTRIAVFRLRGDAVFATQAACPHRLGPLADGLTGTGTVMCPLHDRIYDLRSGEGVNTECRITTYPVTVGGDGAISVTVDAPATAVMPVF